MKQIMSSGAGLMLLASLLTSCTTMPGTQPESLTAPVVPGAIAVAAGQKLTVVANAFGVQIYTCGPAKNDSTRLAWNFTAPQADLSDSHGQPIGKHYAGPTWEANDGSKVAGQLVASDSGPDANAVAWLLLRAKAVSGSGVFAHTASIQRVNTVGGKAPPDGCDNAHLGNELRVPYRAQYYFYD